MINPAQALSYRLDPQRLSLWLPLAIGILALFIPTYVRLNATLWNEEAYEHGPIIVLVFWWLIWRARGALAAQVAAPQPALGWPLLAAGLFMYFVGRTQNVALFEVAAQLPILAGALLILLGWQALRALWFPLLFLLFLIPLPGFVIVGITGQLKQVVSAVAEALLYHVGYPVARDGVVITVGQYRMLVADACSGLNSMYSLSAMGLLYVHLMRHADWRRNLLLLMSVLPIAFAANVVRVIVLILITYHLGDAAGQGFLHNAAGMSLFFVALAALFGFDRFLGIFFKRRAV